jgi:pyruvate/2-oxoglutarate dehydrogenase complex dihydrolipoamide dehydrogenase (E3) component
MRRFDHLGLGVEPTKGLIGCMVMANVRSIIQKAYEKDTPETFEKIGLNVISASALFLDGNHIQINGQTLSSEKFIIATGTTPFIPTIDGLRDIDILTNETLYQLDVSVNRFPNVIDIK